MVANWLRASIAADPTGQPIDHVKILHEHRKAPENRYAQRVLADNVTTWVRGEQATTIARCAFAMRRNDSRSFDTIPYHTIPIDDTR
jgi:tyrosyl-tRNA synthetase